jgi:anti-anti-sigma factor
MKFNIYNKNAYTIFRFLEDVGINTDLAELKVLIEEHLQKGNKNIAIAFTKNSYLYTKSIAILIACSEMVREAGGSLAIIEPNEDIVDILAVIDFDKIIKIFSSEEELELQTFQK